MPEVLSMKSLYPGWVLAYAIALSFLAGASWIMALFWWIRDRNRKRGDKS